MTDDTTGDKPKNPKKNSNVKPLHKGIKVDIEENVVVDKVITVDQELLKCAADLLEGVLAGNIVGLVYVTANKDETSSFNIIGMFPNPDRTQNVVRVIEDDFYELMTRPSITGEFIEYE